MDSIVIVVVAVAECIARALNTIAASAPVAKGLNRVRLRRLALHCVQIRRIKLNWLANKLIKLSVTSVFSRRKCEFE